MTYVADNTSLTTAARRIQGFGIGKFLHTCSLATSSVDLSVIEFMFEQFEVDLVRTAVGAGPPTSRTPPT
jgi:hypothetical protein